MIRASLKLPLVVTLATSLFLVEGAARAQGSPPDASAPSVATFTPTTGTKGTVVTITGKNLGSAQQVRFFSVAATIQSKTDTTLTIVVPDLTPGTYPVTVVTPSTTVSKPSFTAAGAGPTALQFATAMRGMGSSANETANALVQKRQVSGAGQGIDALNRAGYSALDQAQVAKDVFATTPAFTAMLLRGVGHTAYVASNALKATFGTSAPDAAAVCNAAGYPSEDTASALKGVYGQSAQQTTMLLRNAGYSAWAIASALRWQYSQTPRDVALSLRNARFTEKENLDALMGAFGLTRKQAVNVLVGIGYDPISLLGAV